MVDYDEVEINRFTRTFTDSDLEAGYIEDRWEKNKRFIRTVVIAGHFLFYPILIDVVMPYPAFVKVCAIKRRLVI